MMKTPRPLALMAIAVAGIVMDLPGCRDMPTAPASQTGAQPEAHPSLTPPMRFTVMNVTLPGGAAGGFPPGKGSEIANAQCIICHSTDMVLVQPPLTVQEWQAEVTKMRTVFGAPIPADQTDGLVQYLHAINGREPNTAAPGPGVK